MEDATHDATHDANSYLMYWVDAIDAWVHMETVPTFFMTLDFVDKGLSLRLDNESYDDETGEMVTDWTLWDLAGDELYAVHLHALRDMREHALVSSVLAEDRVRLSIFKDCKGSKEEYTEFEGTFETSLEQMYGIVRG